ncbi:dihydrolipoyl dehydrogenase [Enterococcus canis]|nr:dihydrolipoyl dehydrogenase [Enterococcus canis]
MVMEADLLVLGAGTGGYAAAIHAAQLGKKVILVEKEKIGGTCLHRGCIPTKALLRSAELYEEYQNSADFGIMRTGELSVDFLKMQERKQKVVDQLYQGIQGLMKKNKITVLHGEGAVLGPSIFSPVSGAVAVTFNDEAEEDIIIVPKKLIIATGSSPKSLPALPIDETHILSSNGMLALEELPKKVAIVGGGVIGVEWASLLQRLGTEVTIIEFLDRLVINESPSISRELQKQLQQIGVKLLLDSKVEKAEVVGNEVAVTVGEEILHFDKVMVAVGRKANVEGLGLQNTSVKYNQKGIEVNEFYQTTEGHIYAIGDCIDTLQLAHVAMKEGEIAVDHMFDEEPMPLDYHQVPRCTYTSPEIASVGYTSQNVPEGTKVKTGRFNFQGNGKALIFGQAAGFVEVLRDEDTDDLLGVSIIGPHATDLISEASTAMFMDAAVDEIGEAVHPHPTLSEAIQEAALDTFGRAIHK